jgi:hypothetical protein
MARTPKTKSKAAAPAKSASPAPPCRPGSKAAAVITLLKAKRGATIPEMMEDWMAGALGARFSRREFAQAARP